MRSPSPSPKSASDSNPKETKPPVSTEPWLDDMDHLAKTISAIKHKGARPDLLAKWFPELSASSASASSSSGRFHAASAAAAEAAWAAPESPTAAWLKKRLLVESLVAALPPDGECGAEACEKGGAGAGATCDFLLRLLRAGSMVGADAGCLRELEARAGRRLPEASLGELMIPAFGHTCGTLLDVAMALRLVRAFLAGAAGDQDGGGAAAPPRGGGAAAMARVAKLVDAYLGESAVDAGLAVAEFEELARAVPTHARPSDDGLYRAIDTYIKAHPSTTKKEKKALCRLIDARKLSADASLHALQNERLPVRSVVQVLFCEHTKLNRLAEWMSGSFTFGSGGPRSPSPAQELPGRCPSKREVLAHQQEVRRLREDVVRLQVQFGVLQAQLDRLAAERRRRGFFRWSSLLFSGGGRAAADVVVRAEESESGAERRTPASYKKGRGVRTAAVATTAATPKWRRSMS
uniref:NPH3 domain-containing protein n=1 Tax=Ananas comosus var. bracteatus TaxID=296719 RepID=A0A6V7QIM9_ANACO|nr:unnamed protein product [Ananas comosus var. bracteatus]